MKRKSGFGPALKAGARREKILAPKSSIPTTQDSEQLVAMGIFERIGPKRHRVKKGVKIEGSPDGSILVQLPPDTPEAGQ